MTIIGIKPIVKAITNSIASQTLIGLPGRTYVNKAHTPHTTSTSTDKQLMQPSQVNILLIDSFITSVFETIAKIINIF